ncbi:MAG: ATP-binding protein [Rubrobacteraceae bacterium]
MEDALHELLRNSFDAGARNIYIATTLRRRRYRTLTVIDDGRGIPEPFRALIFEPGVTTRHLDSTPDHGAGLSLYHLKNLALSAEVLSSSSPTSIQITFDTETLPERSLQSGSRTSRTNLLATLQKFLLQHSLENRPNIYQASPARILANYVNSQQNHIIQTDKRKDRGDREEVGGSSSVSGKNTGKVQEIKREAERLGLDVSVRTVQRILASKISAVGRVEVPRQDDAGHGTIKKARQGGLGVEAPAPGLEEIYRIQTILEEVARARFLEVGEIKVESGRGCWILRVPVYEPEEEYE